MTIRTEWCVCGGAISVKVPHDDAEVTDAVRRHNETVRHRVWREKGEQAVDGYERRVDVVWS